MSSITTGVIFWFTRRLKLGGAVRFIPYPVVAGFLAGSCWLLIDGSAAMLTEYGIGLEFFSVLHEPDNLWRILPAVLFALAMFVSLNRFPNPATMPIVMLVAVVAFYVVLHIVDVSVEQARAMGHLPQMNGSGKIDLPTAELLTRVDWFAVLAVWPSILVIAGLSMIGLMLNVTGLELAIGRDIDVNAELCSSSLVNIASGSVGGPSGFVGLSMTVLAEKTGALGRSAGIATAVVMLIGLFAAGSLIFQVPTYLTGGFVLFLGMKLLKEWFIKTRGRLPLSEWLIVAVILLAVILLGFMQGLAVVMSDMGAHGLVDIQQGMEESRKSGAVRLLPLLLSLSSEAHAHSGDIRRAKTMILDAERVMDEKGDVAWSTHVHVAHGDMLQMHDPEPNMEAAAKYQEAIKIADEQGAHAMTLRTVVKLTSLYEKLNRKQEFIEPLRAAIENISSNNTSEDYRRALELLEQ